MPITAKRESMEVAELLLRRNASFEKFFHREAERIARTSRAMAERFARGGRLLAFGQGPYATDAQHVSVEFVHPVIVGKRALPALDLSFMFAPWLESLVRPEDIVMGFGPPYGDSEVTHALERSRGRGAMTIALPGSAGDYACAPATESPFEHQEAIEVLYHTLWETVHVFLERRELGYETGAAGFLYPFLGEQTEPDESLVADVAASIRAKAAEDSALRSRVAGEQSDQIAAAALAIYENIARGGTVITLGNGGSATDANDLAIDCVCPPSGYHPIPALSLSMEPANITAVANDVGADNIFLRQLIAHAAAHDVVVAISTSGGSRNIVAALEEARKRKLTTIALLGYDGGEIVRRGLADYPIVVHSDYIPRIQEVQASIYHVIRETLQEMHDA